MTKDELVALARKAAGLYRVDSAIVCAVVEQESNWNPWAIRYEPAFYQKYESASPHDVTVRVARAISWGLMQIMGQTARDEEYSGPYAQLTDPWINLDLGVGILARLVEADPKGVQGALERWNGGSNPDYAAEVMARVEKYRTAPAAP